MQVDARLTADVETLRASLQNLPEPVSRPFVILISGLPGTGKSYFSRLLSERLPAVILESDALRKALVARPSYAWLESRRLFMACQQLVEDLLTQGIAVIYDATNLLESHREETYQIARRTGAKLVIVWLEAPPELVWERMEGRLRGLDPHDKSEADWEIYRRMADSAQPPRRNFFKVRTDRDIQPAIEKVVRAVSQ